MNIFKTTNKLNNKVFVGYSLNDSNNNLGVGKYISKAISNYGAENFEKEILEKYDEIDIATLMDRLEYWINELKSDNPDFGYNETISELKPKKKKLTTKIQVLITPEDEEKLNELIIKQSMKEKTKPMSMSNFIRQLILKEINKNS